MTQLPLCPFRLFRFLWVGLVLISLQAVSQPNRVTLSLDPEFRFQTLDGLGININTGWWYNGKWGDGTVVHPAIDWLVDSLGASIFRAVIEDMDWETVNDDPDPLHLNMDFYDKVFTNARFKGVWKTLRYLNSRGISNDRLILSFMGAPPSAAPHHRADPHKSWMGGTDYSIYPEMEDEFVESIVAFLYYARFKAGIRFTLIAPFNETEQVAEARNADHPNGVLEGPNIPDAAQVRRILHKLLIRLDSLDMKDVLLVTPDAAGTRLFRACVETLSEDSLIMARLASWGIHQYGSSTAENESILAASGQVQPKIWVTEMAGIDNLIRQLSGNANAFMFWDGFDCVYQHARRNQYGDDPPNDWVFWEGEEGKPLLEFHPATGSWTPRPQFRQFAELFRAIKPGAIRIGVTHHDSDLIVCAFLNPDSQIAVAGMNTGNTPKTVNVASFGKEIPVAPGQVFVITGDMSGSQLRSNLPEPEGWYAGDMHVHRNCGAGRPILPETEYISMMQPNRLAVIALLADMGNGEVMDSHTDLPKVNGLDAPQSRPGKIVHWDAEWHFDPEGVTFDHKAIGGHLVMLGLQEAKTMWEESPSKILEWGRKQNAIAGFCHMEYLNDTLPDALSCCLPLDYPVETALGTVDFLSEDVWTNDAAIRAYYKILNCGFRPGWAAGTDYPCNDSRPLGTQLTYVQVKDPPLTYRKWIEGIRNGRTVVSTNGHEEFINLSVNGMSPGDELKAEGPVDCDVDVTWTSMQPFTGKIELVCNGRITDVLEGTAAPGKPLKLKSRLTCTKSSWICARRMDETGHRLHTSPVYISIGGAPVRASKSDALYFVRWIDHILSKTAAGGPWYAYFTQEPDKVRGRYLQARAVYAKIAEEASLIP